MANINEMIQQVATFNPDLARQINKYVKDHSYGLVFEHNLPEAVRLYKKMPCVNDVVNILPERGKEEQEENKVAWVVKNCDCKDVLVARDGETKTVPVEDVVVVVSYKDVIYPGLKVIDKVERGNPDDPYHMVINSENYHALEALTYAYAGQVDCIYIDPPYNTGAKDWKYNNDYVGEDDKYRHSKWLAFMERRLKLAKKLLNPADSVLIVTIDEKEYLRLGMLLEQVFPEARIQMISSVINRHGVQRKDSFYRVDEFIYFVQLGYSSVQKLPLNEEWSLSGKIAKKQKLLWKSLIRGVANHGLRCDRPNGFYPIYLSLDGKKIIGCGASLDKDVDRNTIPVRNDCITVFPIYNDGREGRWQISQENLMDYVARGYVKVGKPNTHSYVISYLPSGERAKIESGVFQIIGYREDGSIITDEPDGAKCFIPGTNWRIGSHDASNYGTIYLNNIFHDRRFSFPKSLYAVHDVIRFFVAHKPNALIIDFFGGSGTTLHAVNLLNAEDEGKRRCIVVTNNEVSFDEQKEFIKQGLRPSDPDWEKYGIANYVTWPRTVCSIEGHDVNGNPLNGNYLGSDIPMLDGFNANAIFCELTYESEWTIRLDRAFNAIAPLLWMQAGCKGKIIEKTGKCFATTNNYGVLFDYGAASQFCKLVQKKGLQTVFVVTDDQRRYTNMCKRLPNVKVYRLYETFLKTFEIYGEGHAD